MTSTTGFPCSSFAPFAGACGVGALTFKVEPSAWRPSPDLWARRSRVDDCLPQARSMAAQAASDSNQDARFMIWFCLID
jgi:hypothetical protein